MKLYKDGQLVGEFSTTELKELAGVDIEKAAEAVEVKSFEAGDKVKVVGVNYVGESLYHGEIGEITKVWSDGDACVDITGRGRDIYPRSSLKLIEEEPEEVLSYENVKIGELFEVVNNAVQKKFPVGNVVRLMDSLLNDEHSSKFEDVVSGEVGFSTYKEIKRHTPEVLSEDNVKKGEYFVITDNNNCHGFEIADVIKVTEHYLTVAFKADKIDGSANWNVRYTDVRRATATEIAEATKPKEVKFEVGDVVKVGAFDFATITQDIDPDGDYPVKYIENGSFNFAEPSNIRHATEEEKSHLQTLIGREKDEYKVGDLARLETSGLRNSLRTHVGCIFEVGHINSAGAVHLLLGDNRNDTLAYTNPKHLKLITPVEWRHDFVEEGK